MEKKLTVSDIKESGMYKLIDDTSEYVIFITGINPFLKVENFVWFQNNHRNIGKDKILGLDYIRGKKFNKIEKYE